MEKLHCTVAVIGGGPAGAIAARDLSAEGIDTVLIQKSFAFQKPCGGGIILRAYEEFGIPQSVIRKIVDTITLVSPKLQKVSLDISNDPLTIVERCSFDETLRRLAEKAGTRLLEAKVYQVEEGEGYRLLAKSGEVRYEIRAETIVAADGVTSLIRKQLRGERPDRLLTYYADIPDSHTDACEFWFGDTISPKEYAWVFPHHEGVNIGLIADKASNISQYYQSFIVKNGIDGGVKPKGYYIPKWERPPVYHDKNVYYVGDSASLVLPFTYEGIYYAMKSGRLAAEAIIQGEPEYYKQQWESLYGKRFRFFRYLQRIFLSGDRMSELMIRLYQNPTFQRSVLAYWRGSKAPLGLGATLWRCSKVCFYRPLLSRFGGNTSK